EHPDAGLFSPARFKPLAAGPSFLKENLDVAFHFAADRLATDAESVEAVPAGGGALVLVEGRHLAVHRTDDGAVHAFSPVCTHLRCVVRWNGADRTWDCPCHGARFDAATGAPLSGPAMHGLSPEEV
ncbi:MAG TPA: Rieske 2Fe-2S domain-containing protein, partial [Rhodothermales bacterium]|nr:Rieske 2Fe-2S domain-containing protein [Rhodothermales bacterium]